MLNEVEHSETTMQGRALKLSASASSEPSYNACPTHLPQRAVAAMDETSSRVMNAKKSVLMAPQPGHAAVAKSSRSDDLLRKCLDLLSEPLSKHTQPIH